MIQSRMRFLTLAAAAVCAVATPLGAQRQTIANNKLNTLKREAVVKVDSMAVFTQQMVDQIFSYGELGV